MEIFDGGLIETRFGIVGGFFLLCFIAWGVFGVIWYLVSLAKDLSKKETRPQAVKEIKDLTGSAADAARFIATDKGFHKEMRREFRPQIILIAGIGVLLLLLLLFPSLR